MKIELEGTLNNVLRQIQEVRTVGGGDVDSGLDLVWCADALTRRQDGVTGEPATVVGVKWVSGETEALGWIGG